MRTAFFLIAMQDDEHPPIAGTNHQKRRAIIIGGTSGIGRALATTMHDAGYLVAVTGRRKELLQSLSDELHQEIFIHEMDVSHIEDARSILKQLIVELGGVEIIVLDAGAGHSWPTFEEDMEMVRVNCAGFVGLADIALETFVKQGYGHLVGISSVMGERGMYVATTYSATKAFISHYLQGIQHRMKRERLPVYITDIRPGFVLTPMTASNGYMFWAIDAQKAARLILRAIQARRSVAYIPERWRLVAWIMRVVPRWVGAWV